MTKITKNIAKGGIATAAVGAMALATATPAQARDRDDGISVGDVIAGDDEILAVVVDIVFRAVVTDPDADQTDGLDVIARDVGLEKLASLQVRVAN